MFTESHYLAVEIFRRGRGDLSDATIIYLEQGHECDEFLSQDVDDARQRVVDGSTGSSR